MGRLFSVPPSPFEIDHAAGILAGLRYQATHDGDLPSTPMWAMLERRFELAPVRFSAFHPNLAMMLKHDGNHAHKPVRPTHWVGCMREPGWRHEACQTPCVPVTPPLIPQTIPEPGSMVLASVAAGAWVVLAYLLGRRESK